MNLKIVGYVLGHLLIFMGLLDISCIPFSLYFHDNSLQALIFSFMITIVCGGLLIFTCKCDDEIGIKEGFGIVTFGWVAAAAFGGLPYMFCNMQFSFTEAFFETMSGLTTTGATVLTNIEVEQPAILFYRSLTHWIGGLGIIVLSLAILPTLGVGGMQLFRAEVPGPTHDKLTPRVADTAKILWKVYIILTFIQIFLLMLGGLGFYDSICHTFATLATGGFSTKNASILHFNSAYVDYVLLFFMFLAGVNFTIHYKLIFNRDFSALKDPEFLFFLTITVLSILFILANVYFSGIYDSLSKALQYVSFTVVSIVTTTGFATADYEAWPVFSQFILLILMFIGGSAGSTGGGMKCIRIMLILQVIRAEFHRLVHPRAFIEIKINNKIIPKEVVRAVISFFCLYICLFVFFTGVICLLRVDLITSIATVAATLGNIGPGLNLIGPTDNYAHLPFLAKWICSFCMLLGRLELVTVLILFSPEIWKK
ncbi:TrkH family potassium uptake protein [Candidatus Riflebacteria bacterium]